MLDHIIRFLNVLIYNTGSWMKWKLNAVTNFPGFWNKTLDKFAKLTKENSRILEIGPGIGVEAEYLLKLLKKPRYTALEPSDLHSRKTFERLWEAGFVPNILVDPVEEISKIDFLKEKKFDVLIAIASLLHIRKATLPRVLRDLRLKLEDNAIGMFVFLEGETEGFTKRGLWFSYYKKEELDLILKNSNFEIVNFELHN